MSKLLCLYNFNPYFNRIIKRFSTYEEYKQIQGIEYQEYDVNVDLENGVYAKHIINVAKNKINVGGQHASISFNNNYFVDPDYVVIEREDKLSTHSSAKRKSLSRWFVLGSRRIRGGQYELDLKRDVIADYYDNIITSPAFIQKATLDYDSPLIFNSESLTYNQIKQREIPLVDDSHCKGWIVGYLSRKHDEYPEDYSDNDTLVRAKAENINPNLTDLIDYDDLPAIIKNHIGQDIVCVAKSEYNVEVPTRGLLDEAGQPWLFILGTRVQTNRYTISNHEITGKHYSHKEVATWSRDGIFAMRIGLLEKTLRDISNNFNLDYLEECIATQKGYSEISKEDFEAYNGIFYKRDGKAYRLVLNEKDGIEINETITPSNLNTNQIGYWYSSLRNDLQDLRESGFIVYDQRQLSDTGIQSDTVIGKVKGTIRKFGIRQEPATVGQVGVDINIATMNECLDSPYNLFAIPFQEDFVIYKEEDIRGPWFYVRKDAAIAIARGIKQKFGSGCYDIQILPYFPFKKGLRRPVLGGGDGLSVEHLTEGVDYNYICKLDGAGELTEERVGIVYFSDSSKGSYDIQVRDEDLQQKENALEKKVASETILARFVSPNYAASFDINPQKNNGITVVNVDYNYKPYTPYIHVAPVFSGLYGQDFNDPRGLIVQGDFSITATSDQWQEYEIQNKNYEKIFNRQIDNMDYINKLNYQKAEIGAVINTLAATIGGGASGASAGAKMGAAAGPYAAGPIAGMAAAGAAMGFATSSAGAIADLMFMKKEQQEARSYAVDMYTYQLGNVKALPYTLTKVSAFNENNKIVPIIEIYDCTEVEKENLRNKLKYNGMTVMVQGKIEDYITPGEENYIQAELIRLEGVSTSNEVVQDIYDELMKGVYIHG